MAAREKLARKVNRLTTGYDAAPAAGGSELKQRVASAGAGCRCGCGAEGTAKPKRWWRRRPARVAAVALVGLWLVVGPFPADNRTYVGSDYQLKTLGALAAARPALAGPEAGPLRAGVAQVDISPPPYTPLAGFARGKGEDGFEAIDSRCYARALTLQRGAVMVTILTADFLYVSRDVRQAVLERTGLSGQEVFFTASHTHAGPGGWGEGFVDQQVAGDFQPESLQRVVSAFAEAIEGSRRELVEATASVASVFPKNMQINRVRGEGGRTYDRLPVLVIGRRGEAHGAPLAVLTAFGAHATTIGSRGDQLSADYPGALVDTVREATGAAMVLFAAGAVGDAAPYRNFGLSDLHETARRLGRLLGEAAAPAAAGARGEADAALGVMWLAVDLPPLRMPIGSGWQASPLTVSFFADRRTYLHVLRVGDAVLVGFPGDYTGELAQALDDWCTQRGLTLMATSFNGDYRGYLVPRDVYFDYSCYETRTVCFYGPWAGEYLNELARGMVERLSVAAPGQ